jgi:hypothetical protein
MAPSQNRTNLALVLKCQTTRGKIDEAFAALLGGHIEH